MSSKVSFSINEIRFDGFQKERARACGQKDGGQAMITKLLRLNLRTRARFYEGRL